MDKNKSEKNRKIYSTWSIIQEVVGPAKLWPHNVRALFWKKGLTNFERGVLAAFVQVNALNPDIFSEWENLISPQDVPKLMKLIDYFKMGKYTYMYSYHVSCNRLLYY